MPSGPVNPPMSSTSGTMSSTTGATVAPTARTGVGVNAGASTFTFRGTSHPTVAGPAFLYPPGFAYRRWRIGQRLPRPFLANAYYYDAFADLGLPAPPPGFKWVRFGSDLVLVNLRTGRITEVVYGVFG